MRNLNLTILSADTNVALTSLIADSVACQAGDTIKIYTYQDTGTTQALAAGYVAISRIGN